MVLLSESLMVVIAATLSGGVRPPATTPPTADPNSTCAHAGARWGECVVLDTEITGQHLAVPWVITLTAIVILSMPTVLLRSKSKEKGLRSFACNLLQCLGLLSCSFLFADHPSICFALGLHSCIRMLVQMEVSDGLLGGSWWWSLRYVAALLILTLEIIAGPPISVVRWPGTPQGTALPCAYLSHLAGCIVPDLVLVHLRFLISAARYVQVHDD
jgi:hypothetical protein